MITVRRSDLEAVGGEVKVCSYSGRGMYGKYCLGVDVGSAGGFVNFALLVERAGGSSADHPLHEFAQVIDNVTWDQLGLGFIYYWRGVELDDGAVNEEED